MDILAHSLWTNYGARTANRIIKKKNNKRAKQIPKINVAWTTFLGVFPDLFAFTIPFLIRLWDRLAGNISHGLFVAPKIPPGGFDLSLYLYQFSHSLVIWAAVFIVVWIIWKRPRFELFGWALHILIDIPSHVLSFFPTPFLFPLSNYRFPYGIQWSNHWYMIINYSLLLFFFIYLWYTQKKRIPDESPAKNI